MQIFDQKAGRASEGLGEGLMTWEVIKLETIFSRPAEDCPVPVAVVFVYFHLDTSTGALTYQFEEENVQHEAWQLLAALFLFHSISFHFFSI